MGKSLYGYKRIKGKYYINEDDAVKVRKLFVAYVAGCLMPSALEAAGLGDKGHQSGYNILSDKRYKGDDGYPAIVDSDLWQRAQNVRKKRTHNADLPYPRYLSLEPIEERYTNFLKQAAYIYSRIKSHY